MEKTSDDPFDAVLSNLTKQVAFIDRKIDKVHQWKTMREEPTPIDLPRALSPPSHFVTDADPASPVKRERSTSPPVENPQGYSLPYLDLPIAHEWKGDRVDACGDSGPLHACLQRLECGEVVCL